MIMCALHEFCKNFCLYQKQGNRKANALKMRLPMYDVRRTMYDLGSSRAERARLAKQVRGWKCEATRGGG